MVAGWRSPQGRLLEARAVLLMAHCSVPSEVSVSQSRSDPAAIGPLLSAAEVVALLGLEPHPEGGHYRETWRHPATDGGRGAGTAIYFLLEAGERSHWHRVDADELWHWYAGAPLRLWLAGEDGSREEVVLGPHLGAGERPQRCVPARWWQAAASQGAWTLAGCTVSPAFEFRGFELAPPGWEPPPRA